MKRIKWLILFLLAGLYFDVKLTPKDNSYCFGPWRQRTLNIQMVIPFVPDRYTLYLGVGNRHWEYDKYTSIYFSEENGEYLGKEINYHGCAYEWQRNPERTRLWRSAYLNLRPFSRINEGKTEEHLEENWTQKDIYLKYYSK